ncbi:MAG: LCP family protein [Chloroflexota bacterium]|jgi:LCP family protein required for cell wall assembly
MRVSQRFVLSWVLVVSLLSIAGAVVAYGFVRDRAAELDRVLELPDPPQLGRPSSGEPTPTAQPPTPTPDQGGEMTPAPGDTGPEETPASPEAGSEAQAVAYAPWDDPRRVSVLLLGIDQRAGEQGTFPTDTIILLSLDPVGHTAAILSIPRDLWVEYPGLGQSGRINGANIAGDNISYPGGGGPAFAVRTVEKELGIKIQYYLLINFEVFTTLIDALGPIEVCPSEPIDDDRYPDGSYGYISIHFDAGCQELDAERLLQYARTRHADSDIGRSTRQQEVILSVRNKVLSAGGMAALLPEAPALWESMQDNIRTNLSFEEMVRLGLRAEKIPSEEIRQAQISFDEVYLSTSDDGEAILVPIASDIRLLIEDLFRPPGTPSSR